MLLITILLFFAFKMVEYINEQNSPTYDTQFELSHILGLNSVILNCVQCHPVLSETISYCVGGIIVTEDLNERNNQIFFRHGLNQVSTFKISHSGRFLAVGFLTTNLDKKLPANVMLWDFENKRILCELSGIFKGVRSIEFSPDDRFISALGIDNSFFIWETSNGSKSYNRIFEFNTNMIRWVRMSFDQGNKYPNYSIIVSNINNIYNYDFHYEFKSLQYHMTYTKFSLPSTGFSRTFISAFYDYNTKMLLVGTTGGEICLFSVDSLLFKSSFNCTNNGLNHLLILSDSSLIIGGGDGKIKKLVYESGKYIMVSEITLTGQISSLTISADKSEIIASNTNGQIFRVITATLVYSLHNENPYLPVNQCVYGRENEIFFSVDDSGDVVQWELNDFIVKNKIYGNGTEKASSITVGDDSTVFVGYSNGSLKNYDYSLTNLLWEIPAHRGRVNCIYADGNYILTGGEDGVIRVWTRKSHELALQFHGHHKEVRSLFSDNTNPNIIYSGGEDKSMNCFDLKLQKRVTVHYMKNGFIYGMDQNINQEREIISVGYNCGLLIWDFFKIEPIGEIQLGKSFFSLKISHSGKYVAIGSEDGEVWILENPEIKLIGKVSGHSQKVVSIQWSPDDKQLISTSVDSSICVWNFYRNQ